MIESRGRVKRRTTATSATDRSYFDNAGHLDPVRALRLLAVAEKNHHRPREQAFVAGNAADDDLAEELGEGAVVAMTSGEDHLSDEMNHDVEEDWGGPFVVTSGSKEFAHGTDESNIAEATREPFPLV